MLDRATFSLRTLPRGALAALALSLPAPALAQNATWDGSSFPFVFNNPDNWDTNVVPTGTATFAGAGPFNVGTSANITIGSIAVTSGAYSLTLGLGTTFVIDGTGIVNTSGNAYTINVGGALLEFQNNATAGNAVIINTGGAVTFTGSSTLGTGTLTTSAFGITSFTDDSNAGAGTLVVDGGLLQFVGNASAATASITLLAGSQAAFANNATAGASSILVQEFSLLTFQDDATAGNATVTIQSNGIVALAGLATGGAARFIIEAGGMLDLSGLAGAATPTVGSIEGAGFICLCNSVLTIGSNNRSTEFSGIISSGPTGGITKVGTGTLILSGLNTYLGPTTVNGGTLLVTGSIATSSLLTVNLGGTIGGTGQLPSTVITGGILAPGLSVGTITVNGNLTLGAGAIYVVEVQGPAADRTNVTGTASLNGTLRLVPLGGSYSFGTPYTILSAVGGRTGTFATIDSLFGPSIRTTVSYDANNVFLTLSAGTVDVTGLTINQRSVATGLNNAINGGADASPFFPLLNLPAGSIPAALDQLGGEVHAARSALGFEVSDQFLRVMLDPFALGRRPAAGPALAYGPGALGGTEALVAVTQAADLAAAEPARIDPRRFAVWAAAFGTDSRTGGDSVIGSHRLRSRNANLAVGADWRVAPQTIIGIAAAGGSADASLGSGLGSLSAEVGQAGAYLMTRFAGLNIGAALAYSMLDVSSQRAVPVLGIDSLSADYNVHAFSGRIEASFAAAHVGDMVIAPLAAFQAHAIRAPAFTETIGLAGPAAAALTTQAETQNISRSELGVRLQGALPLGGAEVTGFARLAWAHYFQRDASIAAAFVGLPGSAFTVTGARPDRDAALISTGIDMRLTPTFALGARFDGEFSGNVSRYAGSARARLEF